MKFRGPLHEPPVSEADIQAYSDGTLAGARAAHVRRYLAGKPGEWHRILFYRRLNAQIRDAYPAPGVPTAQTAHSRTAPARSSRVLRYAIALAAAVAMAGAAVAWIDVTEPSQQVLNNAAVMALMEAENAQPEALEAGAARAPFDFGAAGLHFLGGGEVRVGPFASAQRYVYENNQGERVVLLASRAWLAGAAPQWSAHRAGPLRLLMWRERGTRWVLAGNAQTRGLMRAADLATLAAQPAREGEGS
ncbi:transcriptional regulator [Paraburkholderia sp. CNPSo 3076]|uniref:transcriptional regulator n=1 Tax=Paraburkholderia sp. CNPSo 3076 TaxID=2940936 RepID=UPI0022535777|nr:transcriptional regulator [Paraburkholderia sp. CNPSo 3076]MCX5544019.1 transcriptional regulator [Paraburkholderia sp. CNPSo 3076]